MTGGRGGGDVRRNGGTAVTRMGHTGTHGLESAEKLLPVGGWVGGWWGLCLVMNSQEASPPVRHVSWSPIIGF